MQNRIRRPLILSLALALAVGGVPAGAARAAQGERLYVGYTGTQWARDFGITRGRCDTRAVAAALETSAAEAGQGVIAILTGLDIGLGDRACMGHALELLRNHRTVRWNAGPGPRSLTTGHDTVVNGLPCRSLIMVGAGRKLLATACQAQPGLWELVKP